MGISGNFCRCTGYQNIVRAIQYAAAKINGAAAPGFSSGQAVAAMQRAADAALPRDFATEWTGITFQELKAGSAASLIFGLALVFVFLILAAQYESWTMPLMVLLAVPLALFGAAGYGLRTGILAAPARVLQGAAPLLFGLVLDRGGPLAALLLSGILTGLSCLALLLLRTPAQLGAAKPALT